MKFFNRFTSKTAPTPVEEKKEVTTTPNARRATHALLSSPRVSEKVSLLNARGTYVFNVPLATGKVEIRKAVEKQYHVNVTRVHMIRGEGKIIRRGRIAGKRSSWKKALVTLKKGQSIELHPAV